METYSNESSKPPHSSDTTNFDIVNWLKTFTKQQKNPKDQKALESFLEEFKSSKIDAKSLSKKIDDSCFSKEQWANAIITFSRHECTSKTTHNASQQLSYLSCCAESAERSPIIPDFSHLVSDMLDEFGLEEQSTK